MDIPDQWKDCSTRISEPLTAKKTNAKRCFVGVRSIRGKRSIVADLGKGKLASQYFV